MKKTICIISLISILLISFPAPPVRAAEFDPSYIISDSDLNDYLSMTTTDIQKFLEKKAGTLAKYMAADNSGITRTAAEIIYNAAQEHKINPKFLLVMLQKEQSLVEDYDPRQYQFDWAMGYGVCDNCDPDDPALSKFKGFATQVDNAAGIQRWYIDNSSNGWLKAKGQVVTIDGKSVSIINQATANLYNYTPHIAGNLNFWKIWNSWFKQSYPDGTLLQVEGDKNVWLLQYGFRRLIKSKSVLMSRYDSKTIITVNKTELEKYPEGRPIKYSNYTLFQEKKTGNVFLLVDDKLRQFETKEVWKTLGFNPEEFEQVDATVLSEFDLGDKITLVNAFPSGALLQDKKTGGVFFVQDGYKYPLISKDILKINFPKVKITRVSTEELDKYPRMGAVKIKDGELVKTPDSPSVYFISNGTKRPFASGEVFEKLGFKWANVRKVETVSLSNMPTGNHIYLDYNK
jgi:hypothetical protein